MWIIAFLSKMHMLSEEMSLFIINFPLSMEEMRKHFGLSVRPELTTVNEA